MGTHISKVKSVDLDTWTDEQLQSVLRWGNARANKYWEAKLAPGHVPSEAKIENFIRTKYESKRWVMDGPMPSPEELGEDDDDMPLKKVQEKVQIERSASQRLSGPSAQPRPQPPPQQQQQPAIDLFGDAPPRASSGPPVSRPVPPKAEPAPPKQTKAGDSLLGLDFLGGSSAQPSRPSSTGPASAAPSRPDLKQSILSLYASAPKPAAQQAPQQHARQDSFGGLSSPTASQKSPAQSSFGGMNDAFSSLSFTQPAAKPKPTPSPFSGLDVFSAQKSPPPASDLFGGGGNFFDTKPKSPAAHNRATSPPTDLSGFGGFSSMTSPAPAPASKPAPSSGMGDLLDLSMPSHPAPTSPPAASSSAFNLSQPAAPKPAPAAAPVNYSGFSNMDAWGSNDVWGSNASAPAPAPAAAPPSMSAVHAPKSPGWGAPATADDDFGGWSSAAPQQTTSQPAKPAGGFGGGNDDLFSNVWE